MAATNQFIAASKPLKEALKSAHLLKSLKFNTLILGEPGTGRHTLARFMHPEAPILHGDDPKIHTLAEKESSIIVDRIDRIDSIPKFFQTLNKHGTQVIAIAETLDNEWRSKFSVRIELPPLRDRLEDVSPLIEKFKEETLALFGLEESTIDFTIDEKNLDLSRNAYSLRRSVMLQFLTHYLEEEELLGINESYLAGKIAEGEDLYRKLLYLYEVPLIRAGMKRYGSQLKMSEAFGLNRNTLRKKINEWKKFFS